MSQKKAEETAEDPVVEDPVEDSEDPVVKMADLKGVRYVGDSDVRTLSVSSLENAGVVDPKGDLVWDSSNDWFVPASEINASTRDWLSTQSEFRVE